MQIQTKALGVVDVEPFQVIEFPDGIFGFANYKKYALIASGDDSPFQWLQSLQDEDLAFITIDPDIFYHEYKPKITDEDLKKLRVSHLSECIVLAIVTVPDNPRLITANLQGPVLINKKGLLGIQAISNDDNHKVKHFLLSQDDGDQEGGK